MFYQNDSRWKNIKLGKSNVTIGSHGCLLTSICNIINHKNSNEAFTPEKLNQLLINEKGFTNEGLIIWAVVERLFNVRIDSNYKGQINYDANNYYIVNYINFGAGHFVNLIETEGIKFFVFDVWDGLNKVKNQHEIRRYVKLFYK